MSGTHFSLHLQRAVILSILLAAACALGGTAVHARAGLDDRTDLHSLFQQYDQWSRTEFPERAMRKGDYRFADRLTDQSLAAIERRVKEQRQFLMLLRLIDRAALSEDDRLNYDLFEMMLVRSIEGDTFREYLMPVGGWFGFEARVAQLAHGVRFRSEEDYLNYLMRLEYVPQMVNDVLERMKLGLAEGRTRPRVTMHGLPEQLRMLVREGGLHMLRAPMDAMPSHFTQAQRDAIIERFDQRSLPAVREAMAHLLAYVEAEYLAGCRQSIAATDYPDGENFYNHQIRVMTTLDLTAREVHEIGLREVARIRAAMMDVIRSSDFMTLHADAGAMSDDDLFAAFVDYLRTDERFYHKTAADLLNGYKIICKDIDAEMPALFYSLPRLPYGVREIPRFMAPTMTTAYYDAGNLDNGKAGFFFANTYRLDQRPKYEMIALALHEAVPGHHHQIALAQELENVPEFRRDLSFTAYVEGWALYAEKLGYEMGLYRDPYDQFGQLLYEMWRACRLVVDTGMHAFQWTRQQAIDFMQQHTALSELNIRNEIDRYIAWPGQALGYKLGEIAISELRAEAEATLGATFDLRAFHDVILLSGSVPLPIVERRVREWISEVDATKERDS